MLSSDPILTVAEASAHESRLFQGEEGREWSAMRLAGAGVAREIVADWPTVGGVGEPINILVVAGKGHNGGDALLAAGQLLRVWSTAWVQILLPAGLSASRPLTRRALDELMANFPERVGFTAIERLGERVCDILLDGVFGFNFRPTLRAPWDQLFTQLRELRVRMRVAVDLPSGQGDAGVLTADFTYATGILKSGVLGSASAGRVRLVDLDFFRDDPWPASRQRVLSKRILAPLRDLRAAQCDKRSFGHVVLIGGSRAYPGAIMLAARAALHSGVGLVTVLLPETLAAAFAAQLPEVMWCGCPETPDGGLSLDAGEAWRTVRARATAIVVGPGLGRDPETMAWLENDVLRDARQPVLLDADALQPRLVARVSGCPLVVTPHAGEFARIAEGRTPVEFVADTGAIAVIKGAPSRVYSTDGYSYASLAGGPVLARGGSGDLLAGLIGGRLAQRDGDPLRAVAQGVCWHGMAADRLARTMGETAIGIGALVNQLGAVLKEEQ